MPFILFRRLFYLLILFTSLGCGDAQDKAHTSSVQNEKQENTTTKSNIKSLDQPIVTINKEAIGRFTIDASISIPLFELEWQGYQLRRKAIAQTTKLALQSHHKDSLFHAKSLLFPPQPPRLDLPIDSRPVFGNKKGFIQLSVFCSYQSPHCAKMQLITDKLLKIYSSYLGIRQYHFPQSFHRYAVGAAIAVTCAAKQQASEKFQQSIYSNSDQLNRDRYILIATQLRLNKQDFSNCLDNPQQRDLINRDVLLGRSFGFGNVPVVLVNGLYIKGAQSLDIYKYYIDKELLGKEIEISKKGSKKYNAQNFPKSDLPYNLIATILDPIESDSSSVFLHNLSQATLISRQGDAIAEQVILLKIEANRVIIDNHGTTETIEYKKPQLIEEPSVLETTLKKASSKTLASEVAKEKHTTGLRSKKALPTKSKMLLSRSWVDEQLKQQDQLASYLKSAEHVVEGNHVIRLEESEESEFYQTLGFRNGDVLTRVNEEWVHDGQNGLWDALRNQSSFNIILMRRGYPVHYYYRIEEEGGS
jgi:protein-disulfide isomerase/type II secretory pathway component PulC